MPLPPPPKQRATLLTQKSLAEAPAAKTPRATRSNSRPLKDAQIDMPIPEIVASTAPAPVKTSVRTASPVKSIKTSTRSAKARKSDGARKLFVLDTNVLMHDPMSLFRFKSMMSFCP